MVQENISLLGYNTFGIDVQAKHFARFSSLAELQELLEYRNARAGATVVPLPMLILGGGSNMLFTYNYNGWVFKNELKGIDLVKEDAEFYYVKVAGGENWHRFVLYCIGHGYAGLENLSLIPGCAGASPMQNIGAYGVEVKDVFESLEALDIESNTVVGFGLKDCAFGYRESVFKHQYKNRFIILNVTYRLRKQPVFNISYGAIEQELAQMGIETLSIKAISDAVIRIRSSKLPDPAQIGNAGSFFKNPTIPFALFEVLQKEYPALPHYAVADPALVKVPAGWLIEQCGWKGFRDGDAGCHAKQALVLVNYGKASGAAIYQLSEKIIDSVLQRFGITLEREVNII
ncbi:UDP-N-acetylmuramate dehydrogenase [Filimonas effusa]|uniref:UDP-N-acetylenolpyruvoylglucosamine reductase n=1 Tax=Filimonas effusa TaxID=2508721 RepID=A0A4Q1DB25_9BACT|nr:UDP-N-acetylmuramate dehydrogenase [Filimonas effusa]RXK86617.1 UDP-N-acetylmuramate dehydrogenase [Filimonas effusa]